MTKFEFAKQRMEISLLELKLNAQRLIVSSEILVLQKLEHDLEELKKKSQADSWMQQEVDRQNETII